MLKEKTLRFDKEEYETEDVIYPAINSNAKWKLITFYFLLIINNKYLITFKLINKYI